VAETVASTHCTYPERDERHGIILGW